MLGGTGQRPQCSKLALVTRQKGNNSKNRHYHGYKLNVFWWNGKKDETINELWRVCLRDMACLAIDFGRMSAFITGFNQVVRMNKQSIFGFIYLHLHSYL